MLIPALELKANYQTILSKIQSENAHECLLSAKSPQDCISLSTVNVDNLSHEVKLGNACLSQDLEQNTPSVTHDNEDDSVKKGVLSIAATVAPLPQDLELNPSLLDFVAQVIRPINVGAHSGDDSTDEEFHEIEEEQKEHSKVVSMTTESRPLSFPLDVCITLKIHPSKVILTCNPHSRVRCLLEIPTVSFVISFSLFSKEQFLASTGSPDSSLYSSFLSQGSEDTITINNLNVTGCLKTFALVLYTPQVQSSSTKLKSSKTEDKEAFNLVLGRAFIHFSRTAYHIQGAPVKCVHEYETHQKIRATGT